MASLPVKRNTLEGPQYEWRRFADSRLIGMRTTRYSWWTHWRELADFFLPRRYRWLITPNQMSRGAPINQHIIDSTGVVAARNLAAGLFSGKTSPFRPWFKLKVGRIDSTQTSPVSLWLSECERLMRLVFHESNFYNAMAQFYQDLVVFGTAVIIIYEDFENVIKLKNPCAGEYYVDIDGNYRPCIYYSEFTMTIGALADFFGLENIPPDLQQLYKQPQGANLTREVVVAHAIEPNNDGRARTFGVPEHFAYREAFWVWGGAAAPQGGVAPAFGFLKVAGYYEQCAIIGRWDLVSNDPYGRSPAMDALGDQKQLQQEQRRKAQGIDKMVNPPLVADIQLKNQPASLLPGGITYVTGYAATGKPGFSSVYDTKFPVNDMREDIGEVQDRIKRTFFNDLFQVASQFETRSNITAVEWDMRKSESMVMLGPVSDRLDHEVLAKVIERTFAIMARAGIIPPPPEEISQAPMEIEFISVMNLAQAATEGSAIERLLGTAGNLAGIDPAVMDNIDIDFALDKYASLLNIDPRIIRSPEQLDQIRQARAEQQAQQQRLETSKELVAGAKTLSEIPVGGAQNALEMMTG